MNCHKIKGCNHMAIKMSKYQNTIYNDVVKYKFFFSSCIPYCDLFFLRLLRGRSIINIIRASK